MGNDVRTLDDKPRKRTRMCESCGAAQPTTYAINGVQQLECRRRAPVPSYGELRGRQTVFPLVFANQWCSEWMQS